MTHQRIAYVSDALSRKLEFSYLSNSNLLNEVTDPQGRSISFGNTNDQLTSFVDAKGNSTTNNYGVNSKCRKQKRQTEN